MRYFSLSPHRIRYWTPLFYAPITVPRHFLSASVLVYWPWNSHSQNSLDESVCCTYDSSGFNHTFQKSIFAACNKTVQLAYIWPVNTVNPTNIYPEDAQACQRLVLSQWDSTNNSSYNFSPFLVIQVHFIGEKWIFHVCLRRCTQRFRTLAASYHTFQFAVQKVLMLLNHAYCLYVTQITMIICHFLRMILAKKLR